MGIRLYEYLRRSSANEIVRGKQDLNANVLKAVLTRYAPMQSALDFFWERLSSVQKVWIRGVAEETGCSVCHKLGWEGCDVS